MANVNGAELGTKLDMLTALAHRGRRWRQHLARTAENAGQADEAQRPEDAPRPGEGGGRS